jgi:hypothetical protein
MCDLLRTLLILLHDTGESTMTQLALITIAST